MATRIQAPIWFQTRPSRQLLIYLLSVHGLGAVGVGLADVPTIISTGLGLALLGSLIRQLWLHIARRGPAAVRAVHWQADGRWRVLTGQGAVPVFEDCQVVVAVPALILVRLVSRHATRWLLLAGDSADPQVLRLLRIRLRRHHQQGGHQDTPLAGT